MSLSVEFNGTTVEFDESDVTETLNEIDCYDSEVVVEGYDSDNVVYEAIAMMSCGELVEIYEDSIILHVVPEMDIPEHIINHLIAEDELISNLN
tara:strand:- start:74 stop:355 length:282 start_codon:yes stop_codon:yes gene_type:complete